MTNHDMPIACNLSAIQESDRERYKALASRVRSAMRGRAELSNGYVVQLSDADIATGELAEWIELEGLCCPFLTIELSVLDGGKSRSLIMTGPPAVKALIQAEFPPIR
jgi:hypothetical protein